VLPEEQNPRRERVRYELRASGINPDETNPLRSGIHTRGYLPHIKREGSRYFVTFRLADSLPKEVYYKIQSRHGERMRRFYAEQDAAKKLSKTVQPKDDLRKIERDYHRDMEAYLDEGRGECWLRMPEIASQVAEAIRHFEGERYILSAWVVMPNHVHAALWPMPNHALSEIVQSWKRFTAREANKILGRTGRSFWQPEAFDHWIRNDDEHARCCRYILNNPVKARLCASPEDWSWSSAWRGKPV
jgi:REP element-mobilizing transposase RayT